jgi:MEMO1 family protein
MKGLKLQFSLACFILMMTVSCQSQNNKPHMNAQTSGTMNRAAAVAGQFYPSDPLELTSMLRKYFANITYTPPKGELMALISPHAGYVFSGEVAAAAFNQIDPDKAYHTIFIIGLSHRNSYAGASVYTLGNYETPLGEVTVDLPLAQKLVSGNKFMGFDPAYQRSEHSLEVQMPFLQYHLKNPFKIVPILLGTTDTQICRKVAKALEPYFVPGNLFVISTDFSHYPTYTVAKKVDKSIADAIITNDPERLVTAVEACGELHETNLATGICSWPGVYTLLEITHNKPGIHITPVLYRNSGDSEYGERDRVVGYYALAVTLENAGDNAECSGMAETDKKALLDLARRTISSYLKTGTLPDADTEKLPASFQENRGAFVSLHINGELRGCIGHFEGDKPLGSIVQEMAIAAATHDYRFQPVTLPELKQIDIEISILTPLRKISSFREIILGRNGIYIKKGDKAGTFLPQVATETGWTTEEFLGHCARDKAGIGWDGWKDAELFVYEACVFGEKPKK